MRKAALLGLVLLVAGVALWFFGRPAYHRHKERGAAARAVRFLEAGDFRNANLSARQALAVNPRNLQACEVMAQLAELARAPQVLDWQRRVAEISPTLDHKLKFASTALRVERPPYSLAAQALNELASVGSNNAAFHVVAAQLALQLKKIGAAEAQFAEAARLEPTNRLHELNLAVLRLGSTNQSLATDARARLERLASNTNLARIALPWLVNDCLNRKDLAAAQRFSIQLLQDPRASIGDRLQHLTVLRQAASTNFAPFLATTQVQASTNPAAAHAVANWMIAHDLAAKALTWLTNSPPAFQSEQPVPLALIDCYMAVKDWVDLESWLSEQKWGDMEFVRLAALSRAEEELHQDLPAAAHWRLAVREAGDRLGPLNSLLAMARSWGRTKQGEDLLWHIFERFPLERWSAGELQHLYGETGNTRGLNKLYATLAARDSKDFVARNNFAATAMLLQTSLPKAHETAREIYAGHPAEPIVVSTYAWSLQLQGRTRDALDALQKLKPEALESPTIALYYGLLLSADNQTDKAAKYLALANPASLLPEERALLAAAQKN